MKRLPLILAILVVAAVAGGLGWWYSQRQEKGDTLLLHGNVDLRQVDVAFNNNERIARLLVQEGDHVRQGQLLAELDTQRLKPQVAQAAAQVAAQRQVVQRLKAGSRPQEIAQAKALMEAQQKVVERLKNGTRPEEIAQARANVDSAKADMVNARKHYDRVLGVSQKSTPGAVTKDEMDTAKALLDVAESRLVVSQKNLDLAVVGPRAEDIAEAEANLAARQQALELVIAGPRPEEIAEAEARLQGAEAQLSFLEQQLDDAQLLSPVSAVVRTRIMEPGEMASPQRPVVSLAVLDPKWVRAYVEESDLVKVKEGMAAEVLVDGFPDSSFEGWIGFISPLAEFTPKTVQTQELRTSLVYEVRVFVKDPDNYLRLGMPASVRLQPESNQPLARKEP